jgi:cytochrome c peroxidase
MPTVKVSTTLLINLKTLLNTLQNFYYFIPSLRNLVFTAPYMHDGRFKTLEEVLEFYSSGLKKSSTIDNKMEFLHKNGSNLTALEKKKIIAFLKTLSDVSFIRNKAFSNPFVK